ncbi:hypothetical protein LTS18_007267 [Coniosporium uncinatum]|uniref:Uncharacterized protein n=1 Tax=Coniosporium uncinatum TaxID=93489 RepID=A0ACC3DAK9_9PEZI|nr:hypothetical protein LTS18_007267 [Coniosporium uncinatum]
MPARFTTALHKRHEYVQRIDQVLQQVLSTLYSLRDKDFIGRPEDNLEHRKLVPYLVIYKGDLMEMYKKTEHKLALTRDGLRTLCQGAQDRSEQLKKMREIWRETSALELRQSREKLITDLHGLLPLGLRRETWEGQQSEGTHEIIPLLLLNTSLQAPFSTFIDNFADRWSPNTTEDRARLMRGLNVKTNTTGFSAKELGQYALSLITRMDGMRQSKDIISEQLDAMKLAKEEAGNNLTRREGSNGGKDEEIRGLRQRIEVVEHAIGEIATLRKSLEENDQRLQDLIGNGEGSQGVQERLNYGRGRLGLLAG